MSVGGGGVHTAIAKMMYSEGALSLAIGGKEGLDGQKNKRHFHPIPSKKQTSIHRHFRSVLRTQKSHFFNPSRTFNRPY